MEEIIGLRRTYSLLHKLNSINGANVSGEFLDRVMYSTEALPPLGKEYWWFQFFGRDGRQMMILVFRKFGRSMVFDGEEIVLKKIDRNSFQAVTTGWIYDGKVMHDLGVTNPIIVTSPREKMIISKISDQKMILEGNFPEYELKIDGLVHMKMTGGIFLKIGVRMGSSFPHSEQDGSMSIQTLRGMCSEKSLRGLLTCRRSSGSCRMALSTGRESSSKTVPRSSSSA
ncbi:hypothetical protein ACFLQ6_09825 [Thermoproteota archaeon]